MSDIINDALGDDAPVEVNSVDYTQGGFYSRSYDYNTQYHRLRQGGSINSGQLITEAAGYIPAEQQILGMIAAGLRLEEYRKEAYDWQPDDKIDDEAIDDMYLPLRTRGIDPAEISQINLSLKERARHADKLRRKAEADAKAKAKAKAKAAADAAGAEPKDVQDGRA